MSSLICSCGKEKSSTRKKICDDCRKENKKEKNRRDAKAHRAKHGSIAKRGIYCSRCKGIKENQQRGYCLACERERYLEKTKPDCATCGKDKENVRDSYCKKCKRDKAKLKSLEEGRREKNSGGRKATCSNCGRLRENSGINEGYCKPCKILNKKQNRPYRTEEQKFKEAVRKLTAAKIRQGILIRLPCEICKTEIDVQAHHDDYNKPLDVRWLCRKHHREHHKNFLEDK
jgi:hypothetical protein